MKIITMLLAAGLVAALPMSASAQDGNKKRDRKEALLKKFDKDGDGKLNKEEKAAAREAMKKHRGDKQGGGKRHGKHKKRAKKKADRNGDGKLDRQERKEFRAKRDRRK